MPNPAQSAAALVEDGSDRSMSTLMRLGVLAAMALAACNPADASETIAGEIDDAEIRIATDQSPGALWLELENVGTAPCQLIGLLTDHAGDELPVVDGTVALGDVVEDTYFMGIEVDGSPVPGQGVNLGPGEVARLAIAGPLTAERVVLCSGQGDYEAGRFAVLGPRGRGVRATNPPLAAEYANRVLKP